jgi:hypothetical protein
MSILEIQELKLVEHLEVKNKQEEDDNQVLTLGNNT